MSEVKLIDLVGEYLLTGVDFNTEQIKDYCGDLEDRQVVNFILDNKTYTAMEDPEDSYRSCMETLVESEAKVINIFPPCKVMGVMRANDDWEVNDILDLLDTTTGLIVLSVGTGNTNDYYPYWVGQFSPENMLINKI